MGREGRTCVRKRYADKADNKLWTNNPLRQSTRSQLNLVHSEGTVAVAVDIGHVMAPTPAGTFEAPALLKQCTFYSV